MATPPKTIIAWNVFVDGYGLAGLASEFTPPSIVLASEDFTAAGMGGVDAATFQAEKMEAELTMLEHTPQVMGALGRGDTPITLRAAAQDGAGTTQSLVHTMRGKFLESTSDAYKNKALINHKSKVILTYYKLVIDGKTVHEIDIYSLLCVINGIDKMALIRGILGV